MTQSQSRRPDRSDVAVASLGVVAVIALLLLSRGMTFFADEWAVIADRTISVDDFLRPFNEHWLGVTIVVYRSWLGVFGLDSYLPYVALLAVLHVITATLLYLLVRRGTNPVVGVAIALIALFFGSGFENLYWAMQIGFVGAVLLGFAAMLLLEGRPTRTRITFATGMVTLGVMTSGFGLFMLALVALDLLLDPGRRRWALAMAIPAAVYGAWYVTFGRSGVATHNDPFTVEAILQTPAFTIQGIGTAFGSATGLGPDLGTIVAIIFVFAIAVRFVRGKHVPPRAVACLGAIVVQYAILGTVRAQLFDGAAEYSRYAYLSGMVAMLGITTLMGTLTYPVTGPGRLAVRAGLAVAIVLSLTWNVWLLIAGRPIFLERAERTRASIVVAVGEMPKGIDPAQAKLLDRTITRLREVVQTYGSPLVDSLAGDAVNAPSPETVRDVRAALVANPAGD